MNRATTPEDEKTQSNENDGFKFAVILLVALGTITYTVYNYLQNTPIDNNFYAFFSVLIPVTLILVAGLLFYVLIKGYSREVADDTHRRCEDRAKYIYLIVFPMCMALLILVLCYFVVVVIKHEFGYTYDVRDLRITIVILVIDYIVINFVFCGAVKDWGERVKSFTPGFEQFKNWIEKSSKVGRILDIIGTIIISLGIFVVPVAVIWLCVFSFVPNLTPLQGHITVDMESIYYKNDVPISVLIQVTGPNTGLSIELLKEESGHKTQKDLIKCLEPEHNNERTIPGEDSVLSGNALDYGKYNVFINATNLSTGYYELVCVRPKYDKVLGVKGFYLLNSSPVSTNLIANTAQ